MTRDQLPGPRGPQNFTVEILLGKRDEVFAHLDLLHIVVCVVGIF